MCTVAAGCDHRGFPWERRCRSSCINQDCERRLQTQYNAPMYATRYLNVLAAFSRLSRFKFIHCSFQHLCCSLILVIETTCDCLNYRLVKILNLSSCSQHTFIDNEYQSIEQSLRWKLTLLICSADYQAKQDLC